jgi:hypothetical protein
MKRAHLAPYIIVLEPLMISTSNIEHSFRLFLGIIACHIRLTNFPCNINMLRCLRQFLTTSKKLI